MGKRLGFGIGNAKKKEKKGSVEKEMPREGLKGADPDSAVGVSVGKIRNTVLSYSKEENNDCILLIMQSVKEGGAPLVLQDSVTDYLDFSSVSEELKRRGDSDPLDYIPTSNDVTVPDDGGDVEVDIL